MRDRRVSEAVIRRLPKYYRQLEELQKQGVEKISSSELSAEMGLNASQIRQDFNCFGGFGQQGYGYQVSSLLREIGLIIGLDRPYNVVILGSGHIGGALARYSGFDNDGFNIVGAFDVDPERIGKKIGNLTIRDSSELSAFLSENKIDVGIIATPKEDAQSCCDQLVEGGIKAIWNFAPTDVTHEGAFVENIHLSDYLFILAYRLNNQIDD